MDETTDDFIFEKRPVIKILVVDDREDNLLSMETILDKDGYTTVKANSGRAALRLLLKHQDFTLILMDVQMPDLNGFETAKLIYERDKLRHIPIIFITANDKSEEFIFRGYRTGGVDYIYKPINPDLLRAKVGVFVELYKKNHQLIIQEQTLIAINKSLETEIKERRNSEEKVKILNTQLVENINQLKDTNEELERFAYVASHDLQEPLRKIMLFSDRLASKYTPILNGDGIDYINVMKRASSKMQMLIKNILNFSKTNNNFDSFEETDINSLLENILSDLQVSIEQKNAVIDIEKLPVLTVIPSQFRQLLQNIIINSLKFCKETEPPNITIYSEISKGIQMPNLRRDMYDNDYCSIYIKDNGIGIDPKYANDIFTLFKRLHSYDQFEGTGIGLSICKKIAEKHNGSISVKSELNEGCTFIISIPLKQGVEQKVESIKA
ncbi:MAG: response regulator [Taibaiella sp.]|nr:response regulator [Taibaiella sp.]